MAIFITGSTGYLGSYLVAGLLREHRDKLNLSGPRKIANRKRASGYGNRCNSILSSRNFRIPQFPRANFSRGFDR